MKFYNLHLTESLKEAKDTLQDQSGIYCILCQETGSMYIGSSSSMGERLVSHVFNYSSNLHLQRAIALYGLPAFIFIVIESCAPANLLSREQYWLDWLFALPPSLRFNFSSIAYAPPNWPIGRKRKTQCGINNPRYGKVALTAVGVSILTLD